jgi:hypothetical protein
MLFERAWQLCQCPCLSGTVIVASVVCVDSEITSVRLLEVCRRVREAWQRSGASVCLVSLEGGVLAPGAPVFVPRMLCMLSIVLPAWCPCVSLYIAAFTALNRWFVVY